MLEFKNVSKSFGSIKALENVSFHVDDGEFIFITGPSGSGKTTILKLLIHEYAPTEGEIYLNDIAVHELKKGKVAKLRQDIGVVFQDFKLLPTKTVSENVELALAVKDIPSSEWQDRIDNVLALVGLSERANLFPSQLSGGEIQRAAIARAIVVNPSVIFADEPTGNLDWETADGIMKLLAKINEEGKTIIVTSHNKDIVEKSNKRVLEIKNGKLAADSTHHKHKK